MSERIQLSAELPGAYQDLVRLHQGVEKSAVDAGLDRALLELIKTRVSQINGCAFCTDMHARDARKLGVGERRIFLLPTWWETDLYTEQERAALRLADAMARLPVNQDVPDDVYAEATRVFSVEQYAVLGWACAVINAFNRLGVASRKPLPEEPA